MGRFFLTPISMYLFLYVPTYVPKSVCTYLCMYLSLYVPISVCIYLCMYLSLYVHTQVPISLCTYLSSYVVLVRTYISISLLSEMYRCTQYGAYSVTVPITKQSSLMYDLAVEIVDQKPNFLSEQLLIGNCSKVLIYNYCDHATQLSRMIGSTKLLFLGHRCFFKSQTS